MTIEVNWEDEAHTVVLLEFKGALTWKDYDDGVDKTYALMRTVDHKVDVISFMHPTVRLPKGDAISHIKRAFMVRPPNMRKGLLIGSDLFGEAVVRALIKVKGVQETYIAVENVEAAHAMIAKLNQAAQKSSGSITAD
jgi:hypothetical protein